MSETLGWNNEGNEDEIAKAAEDLVAKEEWIQTTASRIVDARAQTDGKLDLDLAIDGVRFASLWKDQFEVLMATMPPMSDEEAKQRITDAELSALEISEGKRSALGLFEAGRQFSRDMLSTQRMAAAYDAFCLSFGDHAALASRLLDWPMRDYGILP